MIACSRRKEPNRRRAVPLAACLLLPAFLAPAQTSSSNPPYTVTDRGAFYRIWQRTLTLTNSLTGQVTQQVQNYTELGDGLHYWTTNGATGQWAESQDLIEITPTGAAAVLGPVKASFNADITSTGAITLTTPAGDVFASHPLGLFYADAASGQAAQIASVQASQGLFYPPNVVVFSNALPELNADLMLVWTKQGFEQNVVLKQAPPPPDSFGLSDATTRLQMWTAMDQCPQPLEQRPVPLPSGLVDNVLLFADCWLPVGCAFVSSNSVAPSAGQPACVRPVSPSDPNAVPSAKSLVTIANQQVLIEEINYMDLLPALNSLSQAPPAPKSAKAVELAARAQLLPAPPGPKPQVRPLQLASSPCTARGVVLDYTQLSSSANSYTFAGGATYYIPSDFSVGPGTATFQTNACLKFGTNASPYLLVYGPVTFPTNGPPVVFTSQDDNAYGQTITNSTANPNYAAGQALWVYYPTVPITVQDVLIRWANRGLEYDGGVTNTWLSSSVFQNCATGVYVNMYDYGLGLSAVSECNVITPVVVVGEDSPPVDGSMTVDCGVVSVAMINDPNQDSGDTDPTHDVNKNSESECTFILADNSSTIVAAFWDTHLSEMNYGGTSFPGIVSPRSTWWARSSNGGASFTNTTPLPPSGTNLTSSWFGDAGNPVMAYDPGYPANSSGTVYLLTCPSRELATWSGFRLWTSTDKGQTFNLVNTNVPGGAWGATNADRPIIKVNPSTHDLYVAGCAALGTNTLILTHSGDGGTNWDLCQGLDQGTFADIAITPGGVVYVTWVKSAYTITNRTEYNTNWLRYAWLLPGSNSCSGPRDFGITLNCPNDPNGERQLLRFNGDDTNDCFAVLPFPRSAFANGHLYVVYSDLPSTNNSTTDQGDIFLAEAATNSDGSLTLTGPPRTVNNDRTATDQWNAAIAVKPGGTELFIGYYSRQNDPSSNSLIMAYGAKGDVANGLANATFDCFPISPTAFPPLFGGTTASTNLQFDPVFPTGQICLDTNATVDCFPLSTNDNRGRVQWFCQCNTNDFLIRPGQSSVANFFCDDNTWADADSNYFYYAWCDRSRTWTNRVHGQPYPARADADVNLAKIRQ